MKYLFIISAIILFAGNSFGQVVKTTKRIMLYPRPSLTALPATVIPKKSILLIDDKKEGEFLVVNYNKLLLFMHEESKINCTPIDPRTDNIPSFYKDSIIETPSDDLIRATNIVKKGNKIQRIGMYGIGSGILLFYIGNNINNKSNYNGLGGPGIGLAVLGGLTIPAAAIISLVGMAVSHNGKYEVKKASLGYSSAYTLSPTLILANNMSSLGLSLNITF